MILLAAIAALCCTVSGQVHAPSGAPLANAQVVLHGKRDLTASSNPAGKFSLHLDPGSYLLDARADGYAPTSVGPVQIDHDVVLDIALEPSDSPKLRTIGSVTVDGRLALVRNAIPSITISRREMDRAGYDRVIDSLAEVPSVTFARPDGGAASAPSVIALRGPDPSETLVALDGQILNDGNTGDLDLSRFPVAAFSDVDVTEGLGPQDSEGSNTIGGAVNVVSLRPTKLPHTSFSFSTGSFGRSEGWTNVTGSRSRLGYAFALDDQQEAGYVDQDVLLSAPGGSPTPLHLGS
ncbi:MAG: TonB-dependent receptor, partial [Candidatus Baltobacteraceae bacterium]